MSNELKLLRVQALEIVETDDVNNIPAASIEGNHIFAIVGGKLHLANSDGDVIALLDGTNPVNSKVQVTDTGGAFATPIALTEAQSGRNILVDDAAGLDFTLPPITADNIGMHFKFLVTVSITSNSFRVTAGAGDLLKGGILMIDFDDVYTAPQAAFIEPDGTDDLVMTCNGTTTGGKKGTVVEFIAISATEWFVTGIVAGDGVLATPFS